MAGDWIKVEHATLDKPEVTLFAELLGVPVDHGVGLLVRFWMWLDRNSCNGVVTHVSRMSIDTVMHTPGFSAAIEVVGWLEFDEKARTARVPHFDRHNGSSAKSRALTKNRVQRSRNADVTLEALPEKRREEKREVQNLMSDSPQAAPSDVVPLEIDKSKPPRLAAEAGELLNFLNTRTKRFFRPTPNTLRPIMARLKEGYTARECRAVIARKVREWGGDDKMAQYLRPSTLFGAEKFSQYVGEVPPTEVADGA